MFYLVPDYRILLLRCYAASGKKQIDDAVEKRHLPNLIKDSSPETLKETDFDKPHPEGNSSNGKKNFKVLLYISPVLAAALLYQV